MSHRLKVTITNNLNFPLAYKRHNFNSGRLDENSDFPDVIGKNETVSFEVCNKSGSADGVSGWVAYHYEVGFEKEGFAVFAYSNPEFGSNKVGCMGVGNMGTTVDDSTLDDGAAHEVWENMGKHYDGPNWHASQFGNEGTYFMVSLNNNDGNDSSAEIRLAYNND